MYPLHYDIVRLHTFYCIQQHFQGPSQQSCLPEYKLVPHQLLFIERMLCSCCECFEGYPLGKVFPDEMLLIPSLITLSPTPRNNMSHIPGLGYILLMIDVINMILSEMKPAFDQPSNNMSSWL